MRVPYPQAVLERYRAAIRGDVPTYRRDVAFPFQRSAVCVIGPSVRNTAAIAAYSKAGFRPLREVVVPGEPDPEYLMRITRAEFDSLQ